MSPSSEADPPASLAPEASVSAEDAALLEPYLQPERVARMEAILRRRTRTVCLVVEDLFDPHNRAAVLRSAEAFGIQDVHSVAGPVAQGTTRTSRKVSGGAARWLSVHQWPSIEPCIDALRGRGYQIAAAHLAGEKTLYELDFTRPLALLLGNEHEGLSEEAIGAADVGFHIPMIGFVESFNISVAAALCLHYGVIQRQERLPGGHGDLSEADAQALRSKWIFEDVRSGPEVLKELKRRRTLSAESD